MFKFILYNKAVKFFYALALLPLCFAIFKTLTYVVTNVDFKDKLVIFFFLGMGVYVIFHILLYKPIKIYILGHELVHILSAYLCGGRVKKMKIGESYGSVNVDKVNTFIALSPYFIPFYSLIVALLWLVVKYLVRLNIPTEIFVFLLGFTIMFHLVLTLYAIYLGQTDFEVSGWFFSIVVIIIVNCLILIFLFTFIFSSKLKFIDIREYFVKNLISSYKFIYFKFRDLVILAFSKMSKQ